MTGNDPINTVLLKKLFSFLVVLFCVTLANAAPTEVEPMNVLFIGNSYTHMNKMPKMFEKVALSKGVRINVEMSAKSSHTFEMHSKRPEMFNKINSKKWDYVVLQGFSRELSRSPEYMDTASIPFINTILDSIYGNNPCTNVLLYMTWGYKEGYEPREEINTYERMTDAIRRGYEYVSSMYGLPIIPVGDVWKELRAKSKVNLYEKDFQHPTLNGSYLIACTVYSAIFKAPPLKAYKGKVRKRNAKLIQQTAYDFVMEHLDAFKLTQNTLKVKGVRTSMGEFYVHCEANYPRSMAIQWSFGDGNVADTSKVSHVYDKAGEYWITLKVEDACGVRTINRKVTFEEPEKPSRKRKSRPKMILNTDKKI